jgi:hypothetical protein
MKLSRLLPAALVLSPLLLPTLALADTGPDPGLTVSAGTYYVTQINAGALARVTVRSDGSVTIDDKYISGLPTTGPDSAVFASDGTMLVSNFNDGTISRVDVNSRKILQAKVNNTLLPTIADLAADPTGNYVWGIIYNGSESNAISRVDLSSGATVSMDPDMIRSTGGIAFSDNGARLFIASHDGYVAELDPKTGHQVRKVMINGSPDGMSYDPSTGYLFASGCGGICEIDTGGNNGSILNLVKVYMGVDGDGIAADGSGHVYVAEGTCGSLCRLDLNTGMATVVAADVPNADDVTPLTGAGSAGGGACRSLGTCFGGTAGAALAVAGIGLVVFMGAAGFHAAPIPGGATSTAHAGAAHATAAHGGATHAVVAHGATPAHTTAAPAGHEAASAAGPPSEQGPGFETSHLQEEAGEKLLEVGGAGIEAGAAVPPPPPPDVAPPESPGAVGGARQARDEDDEPPPPPPPPPPG